MGFAEQKSSFMELAKGRSIDHRILRTLRPRKYFATDYREIGKLEAMTLRELRIQPGKMTLCGRNISSTRQQIKRLEGNSKQSRISGEGGGSLCRMED